MAYTIEGKIVPNFTIAEIATAPLSNDPSPSLIFTPEIVEFAQMLQEFRNWLRSPMKVNSWYRTEFINRKFGAAKNSAHLDGRACDVIFKNLTDEKFNKYTDKWRQICERHNKIGGVNRYDWGMHFTDYEDKFGNKEFVIRDKRSNTDAKMTKKEKQIQQMRLEKERKNKKKKR